MLIRLVLNFIPIYHMLVNVLLEGFKQKLHGMFSHFLLGGPVDKRKMHLVNWNVVTTPIYQGGLGILNLRDIGKV